MCLLYARHNGTLLVLPHLILKQHYSSIQQVFKAILNTSSIFLKFYLFIYLLSGWLGLGWHLVSLIFVAYSVVSLVEV